MKGGGGIPLGKLPIDAPITERGVCGESWGGGGGGPGFRLGVGGGLGFVWGCWVLWKYGVARWVWACFVWGVGWGEFFWGGGGGEGGGGGRNKKQKRKERKKKQAKGHHRRHLKQQGMGKGIVGDTER